ncbi:MAG: MinD/ParA family protein [Oscillospiraceae bacterium]|nr:MinD/ParA family protein [Oscillospiraceae bacterium]
MNDQASALRQIVKNIKNQRARPLGDGARVVSVASGKGGVGKTSFTVNLAISLVKKGLRVLIMDADFGLANVDVMMGVTPPYNLSHVVRREIELKDAIFEGPGGVRIISGGSGMMELLTLSGDQIPILMEKLRQIDDVADVVLFDTGAGAGPNVVRLIEASEEVVVITTPEPTAIMDAYALIKTVLRHGSEAKVRLVVCRADNTAEAEDTMAKFAAVVRLYLQVEMEELGYVLADPNVPRSVKLQRPFMLSFPKTQAARDIETITWKFMNIQPESASKGFRGFLGNLMNRARKE